MPSPAPAGLAPRGVLRAGLNFSNFLITGRDAAGMPHGVAVDLARELGRRFGLPVGFVGYEAPGVMAADAHNDKWEIAFLAVEPKRADVIDFSPPYLEIEATYLLPAGSSLQNAEEVDRPGARIAVMDKSAYDLYLTRTLKHAELVRVEGMQAAFERFAEGGFDALAGLRPALMSDATKLPGSRLLADRFTAVGQAIGIPRKENGTAAADAVRAFVEDAKKSGLVAEVIARHQVRGVNVAP